MLSVYQLSVPTPYPVGPVNVFLIKNEPLTLVDAGPDTPESKKALREGLKSIGVEIADIKRIFLTHSHPDHCGLAGWISRISGARIYAHPYELRRMTANSDHVKERMPFVIQSGLPAEEIAKVMGQKDRLPRPNLDRNDVEVLHGGETFEYEGESVQVLHLPGHAPGHLCLFAPREGFFFAGDFLLPHITPNPIMEPDPENPSRRLPTLQQYLSGLQVLEQMDIKLVWPGHGGVFNDFRSAIKAGRKHHQKQFENIKNVLSTGRKNCYQISKEIYPSLKGWNVFMGISEIQAHLDFLYDRGELGGEFQNGVMYYWNVGR